MKCDQVLGELAALGTAQNRKIYTRHGVTGEQFGVAFGKLRPLARRLAPDATLARQLWASGNHDARVLATLVADPAQIADPELEAWAGDLDSYILADAFSALAARTRLARLKAEEWAARGTEAATDLLGQTGWNLVAHLAVHDPDIPDEWFEGRLEAIGEAIHQRPNRTRHAMNNALIAIGLRNPELREKALAAAAEIGPVVVDHGSTGCKTPDAAGYIRRAVEHRPGKGRGRR